MKRVEWRVQGERVAGRLHTPPGTRREPLPLVVLGHGMSSSQVEFYDFPEKIAGGGYAALTLDYRGHGESEGERGVLSKERVLADVHGAVRAMASEYQIDTGRVALLGHSLGATLALYAAPLLPDVRCVVALSPPARLSDEMNLFEFVGYNLARVANVPVRILSKTGLKVPYKIDYARLYASQESLDRARRDQFLQKTLPVKNYRPLVSQIDGVAFAKNVRLPALVMVAEYDIVVGKYNSRRVYDALRGPKKFVEVKRSGHSMCGDARSDFVATHVREFLDAHLRGAAA